MCHVSGPSLTGPHSTQQHRRQDNDLLYLQAVGRGLEAVLPTSLRLVLGRRRAALESAATMDSAADDDLDRLVRCMPLLLRRRLVNKGSWAVDGLHGMSKMQILPFLHHCLTCLVREMQLGS